MTVAIRVENLAKAYRIGLKEELPTTLIGAAKSWLKTPFRNIRSLSRLNTFDDSGENPDLHWALKDVSFTVNEGEVVGIIGANGAGKSTLLKILSRITQPTSGSAYIHGRVSSLLEVGTGFHPELSGRENIYMNGTILGMRKKEIDRKFDEIVEFSGVEKFLDTPIKRYSSGMKVRLAFSVAAHLEPEILIIDEVLAVGDQVFQEKCLGKMNEMATGGRTVLFVSHNMPAIESLCGRGILIEHGLVVMDGECPDVVKTYLGINEGTNQVRADFNSYRMRDMTSVFQAVRILNSDRQRIEKVFPGERVHVEIDYQFESDFGNAAIAFQIETQGAIPLFYMNSELQPGISKKLPKIGTIACSIPNLPLLPGRYLMSLFCSKDGARVDHIERGFSFEVVENDIFGTGRLPNTKRGSIFIKGNWEVIET